MSIRTNKPSLPALSFMLRHRETWPPRFKWCFQGCHTCAMGLASRVWNKQIKRPCVFEVATAFGISEIAAAELFLVGHYDAQPEDVADKIDKYLAIEV